jgi:hypothetical protein
MSVCWHANGWEQIRRRWPYKCDCPNGDETCTYDACDASLYAGRTRSGKRWFWMVGELRDLDGWGREHGYADTEGESLQAAQAAADRIAGGRRAMVSVGHGYATALLRELNAEKRKQRPKPETNDSRPVEYLYGHHHCTLGAVCSCHEMKPREAWDYHVTRYPITKKTPKWIYYRIGWRHRDEDPVIGYVNRETIETTGRVQTGEGWWSDRIHLYLSPPEPPAWIREAESIDLKALRLAAAEVHPDREGGDAEEFRVRFERYERARAAVR